MKKRMKVGKKIMCALMAAVIAFGMLPADTVHANETEELLDVSVSASGEVSDEIGTDEETPIAEEEGIAEQEAVSNEEAAGLTGEAAPDKGDGLLTEEESAPYEEETGLIEEDGILQNDFAAPEAAGPVEYTDEDELPPDGQKISGRIKASEIQGEGLLVLDGNTTIIMDTDKKFKGIYSREYSLTVEGNFKTLTIANDKDTGIEVKSFTAKNCILDVTSRSTAIVVQGDVDITGGELSVVSTSYGGIGAGGNVTIKTDDIFFSTGMVCVSARRSINIVGDAAFNGTYSPGGVIVDAADGNVNIEGDVYANNLIRSQKGSVTLDGDVEIHSRGECVRAEKDITFKSGKVELEAEKYNGVDSNNGSVIFRSTEVTIKAKENAVMARGKVDMAAVNVSLTSSERALSCGGDARISAANIGLYGTHRDNLWAAGNVDLIGNISAFGSYAPGENAISSNKDISIKGKFNANNGIHTFYGSVSIDADVTINSRGNGIQVGKDILLNTGTIDINSTRENGLDADRDIKVGSGVTSVVVTNPKRVMCAGGKITISRPMGITVPAGAGVAGKGHYIEYNGNINVTHVKIHHNPITGTANIINDHCYVGSCLMLETSWIPPTSTYQWEIGTDRTEESFTDIEGATQSYYNVRFGDHGKYIRVRIEAPGFGGCIYSPYRQIEYRPFPKGDVVTDGVDKVGQVITGSLTGDLKDFMQSTGIHYNWQRSYSGISGYYNIEGATSRTYQLKPEDCGHCVRLMFTIESFQGAAYSMPVSVKKSEFDKPPVTPKIESIKSYSKIYVTNEKHDQEYVLMYEPGSPDWSKAKHNTGNGILLLDAQPDKMVYVYTRMRETDTLYAGKEVVYSKIFNGYTQTIKDIDLDTHEQSIKVGDVCRLSVKPLPASTSGWEVNDAYMVKWSTLGRAVELYADEACTIPIEKGRQVLNKSVYVKAVLDTSLERVTCKMKNDKGNELTDHCDFEIADEKGVYNLRTLKFDTVIMRPGETVYVDFTTVPANSRVEKLSFIKNSGESDLLLEKDSDKRIMVQAGADAVGGDYEYNVLHNGNITLPPSILHIIVEEEAAITLDSNNGTGNKTTIKVKKGSLYELPDFPQGMPQNEGETFAGWDKGAVGEVMVVGEDLVLKAQWKGHTHDLDHVRAHEPTCTEDGNKEYWICEECNKIYRDEKAEEEAGSTDEFTIKMLGHKSSETGIENYVDATPDTDGGYDQVAYCTRCNELLLKVHVTIPATGYMVTFDPKGGTKVEAQNVKSGEKALKPEDPVKEHFILAGWYEEGSGEAFDFDTPITRDVDLYAKWELSSYEEGIWISGNLDCTFTGKALEPVADVYMKDILLEEGKDYKRSYKNNVNAYTKAEGDAGFDPGKAPALIIKGAGKYTDEAEIFFRIKPLDINTEGFYTENTMNLKGTGRPQTVSPVLTYNGKALKKNKDFMVDVYPADQTANGLGRSLGDEVKDDGVYAVILTGMNDYTGRRIIKLIVSSGGKSVGGLKIGKIKPLSYTGGEIQPLPVIMDGKKELENNVDYTLSYESNIEVGTGYVVVSGNEESGYSGSIRVPFNIVGLEMSKVNVQGIPKSLEYTGSEVKLKSSDLVLTYTDSKPGRNKKSRRLAVNHDYDVQYLNNVNAGTATVIITGKRGYTGTIKKTFKITPFNCNPDADIEGRFNVSCDKEAGYSSKGARPEVTVTFLNDDGTVSTLQEGTDYKLSFKNNKGITGKKAPTLVVSGKNNFKGKRTVSFSIRARDIASLKLLAQDKVYADKAGNYITTAVIVDGDGKKLKAGADYEKELKYTYTEDTTVKSNGTNVLRRAGEEADKSDTVPAGTKIKVTLRAKGLNYTGEISGTYRVVRALISSAKIKVSDKPYTGGQIKLSPEDVTVMMGRELISPVDPVTGEINYTVEVSNIDEIKGVGTVIVRGAGSYGGSKEAAFKIGKAQIRLFDRIILTGR